MANVDHCPSGLLAVAPCSSIGKEGIWEATVPLACGLNGGGGGHPRMKLWNTAQFCYHGECDLVLLETTGFPDRLGIDIHI
jgi:hypothetical protein